MKCLRMDGIKYKGLTMHLYKGQKLIGYINSFDIACGLIIHLTEKHPFGRYRIEFKYNKK